MPRPCPHSAGDPQPDKCAVCKLYVNNPKFREYYDNLVIPTALTRKNTMPAMPERMYGPPIWRWINTSELITTTVRNLLPKLPNDLAGICGVTRSGMLPATALATHLHLPLYCVSQHKDAPVMLSPGSRGYGKGNGKLLVVDDTIYSGNAMGMLKRRLSDCLFAAVYVKQEAAQVCDFTGAYLPSPHLLEWNLFNSTVFVGAAANPAMRGGVAIDFDGLVCEDPTINELVDPEGYTKWLSNAAPLLLPRRLPIKLVITARKEKYRQETLAWCHKWGVKIDKLTMINAAIDVALWKSQVYASSGCSLYIESSPGLAEQIARFSGLPVACPIVSKIYHYPHGQTHIASNVPVRAKKVGGCGKCVKNKKVISRSLDKEDEK